jgi:subtilisin family serine protease
MQNSRRRFGLLTLGLLFLSSASFAAGGDPAERDLGPAQLAVTDEAPATLPTDEIIVALRPGEVPLFFGASHGLTLVAASIAAPDEYVFRAASIDLAQDLVESLRHDPRVRKAFPNDLVFPVRLAFSPNDPFFNRNFPTSGAAGQWHLENQWGVGNDVRVRGAWNRNVTGLGVTVGIIDDSVERLHPDLAPNYSAADSWDFASGDPDPSPALDSDRHGVSVAGVAAARGGNGIGCTGAAPFASIAGLRVGFGGGPASQFRDATLFRSSGASAFIDVKNHSYGYTAPFISVTAERDAIETSSATGTIHAFAAGNSRGTRNQDSAKQMLLNSPSTITVAALGSNAIFASYSSFGGNVVVTAPSSSSGLFGITTTDRTGALGYNGFATDLDYTPSFGGTSSASPLVAGVLALAKQVNPNLNARLAKHLFARSSDVVDPTDSTVASDGGWRTNAAGFRFNPNYGWGRVDANEFTLLAAQFAGVTPLQTRTIPATSVGASIPDNSAAGVSRTFVVTDSTPLEEVLVTISTTHGRRGDLAASLTSPSGTRSRLFIHSTGDTSSSAINWTFLNHAFWGENPRGTWTLTVADRISGTTGTWNSYGVTLRMGTPVLATRQVQGRLLTGYAASLAAFPVSLIVRDAGNNVVDAQSLPLTADGRFTYTTSLSGTFSLSVKAGMWLRERVDGVVIGPTGAAVDFPMRAGDVVEDNAVDLQDFLVLAAAYETSAGDAAFSVRADLDGSGKVDLADFLMLAANYDTSGDD